MAEDRLQIIQDGLSETRENLVRWMEATPEPKKEIQCCAKDTACVEQHLQVIDNTLDMIRIGAFGICEICHDQVDDALLKMDYTSSVCLGHFTDGELRELETELELSKVVQRGLLPQEAPSIPGLTVAAFSRPAQIISGDYFDFVAFKDGGHGIVISDVSGHGVSAGMFMSSLQTAFQTLVPTTNSPLEVLERINHLFTHNINFTTFVTVFFGKFDPAKNTFQYGNAGHNPAYLYRASDGAESLLHPTGPAIGLMEAFSVRLEQVQLQTGDTLVLYTDGVTEAMNTDGTQFGLNGLAEVIRAKHDLSPERLIQEILTALIDFTGGRALLDDVTVLVCRATQ